MTLALVEAAPTDSTEGVAKDWIRRQYRFEHLLRALEWATAMEPFAERSRSAGRPE